VRGALDHLYDVVALHTHSFADLAARGRPLGTLSRGEALRHELLDAIGDCEPPAADGVNSRAARRYRVLQLRYVDGKEPAEAQRELGLSRTQYYRELQSAISGLAALLWERWGLDAKPPASDPGAAVPADLFRRHVLVGRDVELHQLQRAFDAALAGEAGIVAVVGEPGIGKTALAEQLVTYVGSRGGRALVGHSYEPGSLAIPYLPFVEAFRTYVLGSEAPALAEILGRDVQEVARILPELPDLLSPLSSPSIPRGRGSEVAERIALSPQLSSDPDEDRWRLYQALTDFLQRASATEPLLLCLEDLHWADRGTLDLLVHLARRLQRARLLIVVNYRDAEVDRAHPLSWALAELRRVAAFQRIRLRGLSADHVHTLLGSLAGRAVGRGLADAVHGQTEGNPLFVRELLRHLAEEGLLAGADASDRASSLLGAQHIPEGLRDVIGQRLSRLSPATNQVLAIAAVLGREFTLPTLQAVGELTDEIAESTLEEAVRGGLLEDRSQAGLIRFRFAHAFFRQTLYEELFSARRLRLHQQVARALEQVHADHLDEHAAELAEHFAQSTHPVDLRKAVKYGKLAARRAVMVSAYGEAARLLEQALQAQDVLNPRDRGARCDLLLAMGEVLGPAGNPRRVYEDIGEEAFRLAEALGDADRAARASRIAIDGLERQASGVAPGMPILRTWAERADRHAVPGTSARVWADIMVGKAAMGVGDWERARAARDCALDGARALGHARTVIEVGGALLGPGQWWPGDQDDLIALARELNELPSDSVPAQKLAPASCFSIAWLLAAGDRPSAEDATRRFVDLAERSGDPRAIRFAIENEILFATLDGDFERILGAGGRLRTLGSETGGALGALLASARTAAPVRYYLGRARDAVRAYDELGEQWPISQPRDLIRRGLYDVHAEPSEPNVAALRAIIAEELASTRNVRAPATLLIDFLQAAVLVRDRDACAVLARLLSGTRWLAILGPFSPTAPGRHLGDAARLLGDREGARASYEAAIEATTRVGHRPELALTRLRLAELLLEDTQSERVEAERHLRLAIPELNAMAMRPFLERAGSILGRPVKRFTRFTESWR
jgi:tetratricopeptide (TPR) repeat protein